MRSNVHDESRTPRRLLTALLFASLTASLLAQPTPKLEESIEVSIVNVDVMVVDKSGKHVTGLTANDFEIREDGKVQPITNFAEYAGTSEAIGASIEPGAEAQQPAPQQQRQKRTIVIFVENSRLVPFNAKKMFDGIRDLLHGSVEPGDQVTVVSFDGYVYVRQQFTDDLAKLDRTLDELENEAVHGPRDVSAEVRASQAESNADFVENQSAGPGGTQAASPSGSVDTPLQARSVVPPVDQLDAALRQLEQIRNKTFALEALMNSISGMEGKKILIMAMRRFGLHAGAEYFGGFVPTDYRSQLDTTKLRDSLIRTANANGISLYPVYPLGGVTNPTFTGFEYNPDGDVAARSLEPNVMMNETTALEDMAQKTGGLFAWGSDNIAQLMPRVADDLSSYYSLAYRSKATGKDNSRKIVVKTKSSNYEVRTRQQVVEKSDVTQMNDRVMANLYQPIGGSLIPFEVGVSKPKNVSKNRWTMTLRVRVPIKSLTTIAQNEKHAGEFGVYIATGGVVGVMSEVERRTQPFKIPVQDLPRAKNSFFTFDFELKIDQKVDRVSVGVRDEVGKDWGLRRIAIPDRR